uniref:Fibronectin type-III domain-containing protein n=1 Tax=Mesocestoides corti TaxID=53468 RepID=A0A5K3EK78_MESCO
MWITSCQLKFNRDSPQKVCKCWTTFISPHHGLTVEVLLLNGRGVTMLICTTLKRHTGQLIVLLKYLDNCIVCFVNLSINT